MSQVLFYKWNQTDQLEHVEYKQLWRTPLMSQLCRVTAATVTSLILLGFRQIGEPKVWMPRFCWGNGFIHLVWFQLEGIFTNGNIWTVLCPMWQGFWWWKVQVTVFNSLAKTAFVPRSYGCSNMTQSDRTESPHASRWQRPHSEESSTFLWRDCHSAVYRSGGLASSWLARQGNVVSSSFVHP